MAFTPPASASASASASPRCLCLCLPSPRCRLHADCCGLGPAAQLQVRAAQPQVHTQAPARAVVQAGAGAQERRGGQGGGPAGGSALGRMHQLSTHVHTCTHAHAQNIGFTEQHLTHCPNFMRAHTHTRTHVTARCLLGGIRMRTVSTLSLCALLTHSHVLFPLQQAHIHVLPACLPACLSACRRLLPPPSWLPTGCSCFRAASSCTP